MSYESEMQFFQDASVKADYAVLGEVMSVLAQGRPPAWTRWSDREPPTAPNVMPATIALRWKGNDRVPSAVAFVRKDLDRIHVPNILREDREDLTREDYNYLVELIAADLLAPAAKKFGAILDLSPPDRPITDWISMDSAKLLVVFSQNANRWALHDYDERRWADFLIALHNEKSIDQLDPEILVRWLVEEGKWPEKPASDLGQEYEFARRLLREYDAANAKRQ